MTDVDLRAVHLSPTAPEEGNIDVTGTVTAGGVVLGAGGGGGGGGAGSDTTAVHVGVKTFGSVEITEGLEAGGIYADWGLRVRSQSPPENLAAVLSSAHPTWDGSHVPAGDHTWQLDAYDTNGHRTLPTPPVTVTIPDPNTDAVLLTWTDLAYSTDAYPEGLTLYRDGGFLATLDPKDTQYLDTGASRTYSTAPASVNGTGSLQVDGPITAHGNPVPEAGAITAETITPDHTVILTINGVNIKVAGVLA